MSEPRTFRVRATQGRPAWLPLFVLTRNNLNPRVAATDTHLEMKVVTTKRIAWSEIASVDVKPGLRGVIVSVVAGGWENLIHLDAGEAKGLLQLLAERGAKLTSRAAALR